MSYIYNMKERYLLFAIVLTASVSCNNPSADQQRKLELKEKEVTLKEQKLKVKEKANASQNYTTQVAVDKSNEIKNDELSNTENLVGYWFTPHSATINILFRNGRFIFNDYNVTLDKEEILQGDYKLDKGTLILLYDDRPKQEFKFFKGDADNYYIKKSGYYFVKGESPDYD
ncbi:hypothetical protein GCM10022409_30630 [Hymenobacter glaciei]|uniref:Lipocalin-like domain-containing protein n=1 Tax=Hymenobacter glaciei TaxID=877209 RepID=A0ABP7UFY5_9BACT